ncbi:MAG: hypothetical protein NTX03_14810 [Bacteroidetes bacterium]|nr:hypothetical protein [Bacteroidota bacterium]
MSKLGYIPRPLAGKNNWLANFATELPNYKVKYGIPDADVNEIIALAATFAYIYGATLSQKAYGKAMTLFMKIVLEGTDGANPTGVPVYNAGVVPATLIFDGLKKIRSIVARIKAATNYSETDGQILGIIGIEQGSPEDPSTWKPHITAQRQGDFVEILWGWEGHPADGAEIQVDRTNTGWGTIAIDPDPNYTDTFNIASLPNPTQWKFRAIYRKNGVQVGQWSDVMVVAVP